eukprot:CAMPEP_0201594334 /NCGR_PEP_ID=MMETSP0190_2-20130828/191678_1 /ASSEMBLY_ACC=CAM_ASM_000263 /TAXON_ID=37353 /ORGANISM="Rosalina sp." /LENGTH=719 /DNA_ID=CAMNT_0048053895 /DNA_START=1357 /DNA_END=3514 /DNA_ORIENTATION=-
MVMCMVYFKDKTNEFSDEEIDEIVDEQMPIITKNQQWQDDYESDVEHGEDEEEEQGDGFFKPPEIISGPNDEQQNNWDILRIYTDIDEEVEYLEENYMPEEMKWHKKKRKAYNLAKVGYIPLDETEFEHSESIDSIDSYEERRGFEGQNHNTHWNQARDAAELGFIPVNEDEEYDAAASKMLHKNKKENIEHKRKKRHERENSVSSKISSIFKRGGNNNDEISTKSKKKKDKEKKRRRSSRLSQLLSFGSKKDIIDDNIDDNIDQSQNDESQQKKDKKKKKYKKVSKKDQRDDNDDDEYDEDDYDDQEEDDQYYDDGENDGGEEEEYYDDDYDEEEDDQYYDDDGEEEEEEEEESETSSQRRRRRKKEKKRNKKNKKKKPAMSSMNAPKPMQTSVDRKKKRKSKNKNNNNDNEGGPMEIELERSSRKNKNKSRDRDRERDRERERERYNFTDSQINAGEYVAMQLSAPRRYNQFNKILQIGRINRAKIKQNPKLLSRMVENGKASGDTSLIGSEKIVKRATKLIKRNHELFNEIESGATDANQKHIQKLLRKQDVINTVFSGIDGNKNNGLGGNFAYSPAELRKLEELPERAPSQRPIVERKTNIDDSIWDQSNIAFDQNEINNEDLNKPKTSSSSDPNGASSSIGNKNKVIDMDDIWEVTGALPPELLSALEDPYDAWKEDELKPVQKPLRDDEEDEYRDKLTNHFKQRRDLLKRKYW